MTLEPAAAPSRVGCNLLGLVPGVVGGSEEYTVGLLRTWASMPERHRDLAVTLFVNRAFVEGHPDLVDRFSTAVAPFSGASKAARVVGESTWLVRAARQRRVEVMHHTGGTMPLIEGGPGVVTVHDLQPWAMPEHFSLAKRAYLHAVVPRSVRRARVVVTLSDWARRDIASRLVVDADKVVCVPPGLDDAPPPPVDEREVLRAYQLEGRPFFLYPAITYPHKNHETLVRAFADVVADHPEVALVLTAGTGPSEGAVRSLMHELGLARSVRRTGRIPADHLDLLYRRAVALAFPSRYEGFGLPVLEAMSRGCPVLAARNGALPEVIASGGALLDPDDVGAWAREMRRVLVEPAHREALAVQAQARASEFSWQRAVDRLADVYRLALGRTPSTGVGSAGEVVGP
jgi:glycosyltransferase involved in cell wall biosynthesis